jgi:hypothetical protein
LSGDVPFPELKNNLEGTSLVLQEKIALINTLFLVSGRKEFKQDTKDLVKIIATSLGKKFSIMG